MLATMCCSEGLTGSLNDLILKQGFGFKSLNLNLSMRSVFLPFESIVFKQYCVLHFHEGERNNSDWWNSVFFCFFFLINKLLAG